MYHVGKTKSRGASEKRPETAGGGDAIEISPSPKLHSCLVRAGFPILWDRGQHLLTWVRYPFPWPAALVLTCIPMHHIFMMYSIQFNKLNCYFQFICLTPPMMVSSSTTGPMSYSSEHPHCLVQNLAQSVDYSVQLHSPSQPVCSINWSSQ